MRSVIRAIVLALTLLCAQQIALAHAVSHFDGKPKQEGQQRLCELHSAMDALLGAMDAVALAARPEQPAVPQVCIAPAGDSGLAAPAPQSRGPPPVSRK